MATFIRKIECLKKLKKLIFQAFEGFVLGLTSLFTLVKMALGISSQLFFREGDLFFMANKKYPQSISRLLLASLVLSGVTVSFASVNSQPVQAQVVNQSEQSQEFMSDTEKQRAIDSMTQPNEGNVLGWSMPGYGPNGGPGQFNSGSVVQGGLPNMSNPADWWKQAYRNEADAENAAVHNEWFDIMEPWGVFMEMEGNNASSLKADVRNVQVYVLREGSNQWELLHEDKHAISWTNQFKPDMQTAIPGAAGEQGLIDGGHGGTTTNIEVGTGNVNHWGSNRLNNIPEPWTIRGVMVTAESRLSEDTSADAKIGFQLGADYKYNDDGSKMKWYPGLGTSRINQLSKDWERYYFVNLNTAQDATPERSISEEQFKSTNIPLADLK